MRIQHEGVQVLTIHGAKGLEFPVVAVVVDTNKNIEPERVHQLERAVLPFRRTFRPAPIPMRSSVVLMRHVRRRIAYGCTMWPTHARRKYSYCWRPMKVWRSRERSALDRQMNGFGSTSKVNGPFGP